MAGQAGPACVPVVVELGQPVEGGWCDACQLSTLVSWPILGLLPSGTVPLGTASCCAECGDPVESVERWRRETLGH